MKNRDAVIDAEIVIKKCADGGGGYQSLVEVVVVLRRQNGNRVGTVALVQKRVVDREGQLPIKRLRLFDFQTLRFEVSRRAVKFFVEEQTFHVAQNFFFNVGVERGCRRFLRERNFFGRGNFFGHKIFFGLGLFGRRRSLPNIFRRNFFRCVFEIKFFGREVVKINFVAFRGVFRENFFERVEHFLRVLKVKPRHEQAIIFSDPLEIIFLPLQKSFALFCLVPKTAEQQIAFVFADELQPERFRRKFHVGKKISVIKFNFVQATVNRSDEREFHFLRDKAKSFEVEVVAFHVDKFSAAGGLHELKKISRQAVKVAVLPEGIFLKITFAEQELRDAFHDVLGHFLRAKGGAGKNAAVRNVLQDRLDDFCVLEVAPETDGGKFFVAVVLLDDENFFPRGKIFFRQQRVFVAENFFKVVFDGRRLRFGRFRFGRRNFSASPDNFFLCKFFGFGKSQFVPEKPAPD